MIHYCLPVNNIMGRGQIIDGQAQGMDCIKSSKEQIIYQSKIISSGRAKLFFAQITRLQGFACFFNERTKKKGVADGPSLAAWV